MPIVFIHGVAVRGDSDWSGISRLLQRYIAPEISDDAKGVELIRTYWGDIGAAFAWGGASRPRTPVLGQGAEAEFSAVERAVASAEMANVLVDVPVMQPAVSTGGLGSGAAGSPAITGTQRLKDLSAEELSDLMAAIVTRTDDDGSVVLNDDRALAVLAADDVAHAPGTGPQLAAAPDRVAELEVLQTLVARRYMELAAAGLTGQGMVPRWVQELGVRIGEALDRADDAPGFIASRVVAEFRRPLNDFVTLFLGDVFTYLKRRGTAEQPGLIPNRFLDDLHRARIRQVERGGEPIVVLSHSMGGQIVYDALATFLPAVPALREVRVDFWCATASQVALFEELKLFLSSAERYGAGKPDQVAPVPSARHLGYWWNVWDHNDFISYTGREVFGGVDDGSFNSGMSLLQAHSGYLARPSFYRAFAKKLRAARANGWRHP
jgi:hypothetical protein